MMPSVVLSVGVMASGFVSGEMWKMSVFIIRFTDLLVRMGTAQVG